MPKEISIEKKRIINPFEKSITCPPATLAVSTTLNFFGVRMERGFCVIVVVVVVDVVWIGMVVKGESSC